MELELYAFVFSHSLFYGEIIYSEDGPQKSGVSCTFSIPKFVRWTVLFSEFLLLIHHIPGAQNVVSDGLTTVMSLPSSLYVHG